MGKGLQGTVRVVVDETTVGYIAADDGRDIAYVPGVVDGGPKSLSVGQRVEYRASPSREGRWAAVFVRIIGG